MEKIELQNLSKVIKKKTVLNCINLTFEKGKIYGLYGRNGSGKTMLLRAISGLIRPTEGTIIIDGKMLHRDMDFPSNLGVIIENTTMLPQFDGYTNLRQLAKLKGIANDNDLHEALSLVGLEDEPRKVKAYSLGMKQRLSIAQAIFEKPELLLLDEPTNALDEEYVHKIREILLDKKEKGAIIIIASHNKDDLKILADTVITLNQGKVTEPVIDWR